MDHTQREINSYRRNKKRIERQNTRKRNRQIERDMDIKQLEIYREKTRQMRELRLVAEKQLRREIDLQKYVEREREKRDRYRENYKHRDMQRQENLERYSKRELDRQVYKHDREETARMREKKVRFKQYIYR